MASIVRRIEEVDDIEEIEIEVEEPEFKALSSLDEDAASIDQGWAWVIMLGEIIFPKKCIFYRIFL